MVLTDEDHRYLTRVLRLGIGETVTLFDGKSVGGDGAHHAHRAARARAEDRGAAAGRAPIDRPEVTLIQALAKGDKLDLVVQKATELGVARIIPVTTARAVTRLDAGAMRTLSRRARWQKIAREASRQSGRRRRARVEGVTALSTALQASPKDALQLIFWEGARRAGRSSSVARNAAAARSCSRSGPRADLPSRKWRRRATAGFIPVGLGPRVLRTETAALVVLAILQLRLGDLA